MDAAQGPQMAASPATRRLGLWSAAAALACSLAYDIAQVCEWLGWLGSSGGPNASSTAFGLVLLLTPSLLLGSAFVCLLSALYQAAPRDRRAFTLAALALGVVYATLTGMVYFVQLTFVGPRIAAGDTQGIELLLFVPYRSFLFAVDLLGYGMMCLACMLAALGLPRERPFLALRRALLANGALAPFLLLQMTWPVLIWPAALWAIVFPLAMYLAMRLFSRLPQSEVA